MIKKSMTYKEWNNKVEWHARHPPKVTESQKGSVKKIRLWYFGLLWLKTKQILVFCPYYKEVHDIQGMERQSRRMTCETTSTPPLTQRPFSIKKKTAVYVRGATNFWREQVQSVNLPIELWLGHKIPWICCCPQLHSVQFWFLHVPIAYIEYQKQQQLDLLHLCIYIRWFKFLEKVCNQLLRHKIYQIQFINQRTEYYISKKFYKSQNCFSLH